jgi:hypothetical protein
MVRIRVRNMDEALSDTVQHIEHIEQKIRNSRPMPLFSFYHLVTKFVPLYRWQPPALLEGASATMDST